MLKNNIAAINLHANQVNQFTDRKVDVPAMRQANLPQDLSV